MAVSYVSPNPALRFVMFSLCFDMYTVETTGNNFFPLFRQPSISTIVETVSIPQFRQPHVSTRRNCGYIFRNTGKKLSKHWDVETLVCRNNGITPFYWYFFNLFSHSLSDFLGFLVSLPLPQMSTHPLILVKNINLP